MQTGLLPNEQPNPQDQNSIQQPPYMQEFYQALKKPENYSSFLNISNLLENVQQYVQQLNIGNLKKNVAFLIGPTSYEVKNTYLNILNNATVNIQENKPVAQNSKQLVKPTSLSITPQYQSQDFLQNWQGFDNENLKEISFVDLYGETIYMNTFIRRSMVAQIAKQQIMQQLESFKLIIIVHENQLFDDDSSQLFLQTIEKVVDFIGGNMQLYSKFISLQVISKNQELKVINFRIDQLIKSGNLTIQQKELLQSLLQNKQVYKLLLSDFVQERRQFQRDRILNECLKDFYTIKNAEERNQLSSNIKLPQYEEAMVQAQNILRQRITVLIKGQLEQINQNRVNMKLSQVKEFNQLIQQFKDNEQKMTISHFISNFNDCSFMPFLNMEQIYSIAKNLEFIAQFCITNNSIDYWGRIINLNKFLSGYSNELDTITQNNNNKFYTGVSIQDTVLEYRGYNAVISEILKQYQSGKTKLVRIFAINEVTIDQDISLSGCDLAIIAPKWNVVIKDVNDKIKINLKGQDSSHQSKAEDGKKSGEKGKDGLPGQCGQRGGSFYGVALEIHNVAYLYVNVKGGKGGNGGDGGDGKYGNDGADAQFDGDTNHLEKMDTDEKYYNLNRYFDIRKQYYGSLNTGTGDFSFDRQRYRKRVDNKGDIGGNGGNGGKRGKGGKNGLCQLFINGKLYKDLNIEKYNCEKDGEGQDGRGGHPGMGGRNGRNLIQSMIVRYANGLGWATLGIANLWNGMWRWVREHDSHESNGKRDDGKNGQNGANTQNQQEPENIDFSPAQTINLFQSFILKMNTQLKYVDILDSDIMNEVGQLYQAQNVQDLLQYCMVLENNYSLNNNSNSNFKQMYKHIVDVCLKYMKNIDKNDRQKQIQGLRYVQNLAYSGICRLNTTKNGVIVVDMEKYLEVVEKNIDSCTQLQVDQIRQGYKKQYNENIQLKIKDASDLCSGLLTDVEEFENQMDDEINSVVEEIKVLKAQEQKEVERLTEKQQRLDDLVPLKGILSGLKVGCKALAFLGPEGAIAGVAISACIDVGSGFLENGDDEVENEKENQRMAAIKKRLGDAKGEYDGIMKNVQAKKDSQENKIKMELKEGNELDEEEEKKIGSDYYKKQKKLLESQDEGRVENKNGKYVEKLDEKIRKAEEREKQAREEQERQARGSQPVEIEMVDMGGNNEEQKQNEEQKENNEEQKENQEEQKEGDQQDQKKKKKQPWISDETKENIMIGIEVGKEAKAAYDEYQKNKRQINIIQQKAGLHADNVQAMDQKIKNVETIYNDMMGDGGFSQLVDQFQNQENIKKLSSSQLLKQGYMVKNQLSDMQIQLKNLVGGFAQQNQQLQHLLDKVMGAFQTMIQIYEQIQNYQDQANFANYLTDLQQNPDNLDQIFQDDSTKETIKKLQICIKRNLLSYQYHILISSFIQWSFPFGQNYFQDMISRSPQLAQYLDLSQKNSQNNSLRNTYNSLSPWLLPNSQPPQDKEQIQLQQQVDFEQNLQKMIGDIKQITEAIQEVVKTRKSTISNLDNIIQNVKFQQDDIHTPFVEWNIKDYRSDIDKLLNFEEVNFLADSNWNQRRYNAVKFKTVQLKISIFGDQKSNEKLQEMLKKLKVEMVHSGDNYYLLNENTYKISSNGDLQQQLRLIYEYGNYCESNNETIRKLSESDPMLSPYTFWKIKLTPINPETPINYLQEFKKSQLNVALVGKGQFIDQKDSLQVQQGVYNSFLCNQQQYSTYTSNIQRLIKRVPYYSNIFLERNNPSYVETNRDLYLVQNQLLKNYKDKLNILDPYTIQGEEEKAVENIHKAYNKVNKQKPTLMLLNLGEMQWCVIAVYVSKEKSNKTMVLYKDSRGIPSQRVMDGFQNYFGSIEHEFIYNTCVEEYDGYDSGIFALLNMKILADGLYNGNQQFLENKFQNYTGFCSQQQCSQMRLYDFSYLYVAGVAKEVQYTQQMNYIFRQLQNQKNQEFLEIKEKIEQLEVFKNSQNNNKVKVQILGYYSVYQGEGTYGYLIEWNTDDEDHYTIIEQLKTSLGNDYGIVEQKGPRVLAKPKQNKEFKYDVPSKNMPVSLGVLMEELNIVAEQSAIELISYILNIQNISFI